MTKRAAQAGVTLVELMVTMSVLVFIMAMLLALTNQTSRLWKGTTAKIEAFQNARAAYHSMTQRLSQATLNTHLDYYDATNNIRDPYSATPFTPSYYARNSELHFTTGPVATLVPNNGLTHTGHSVFFVAPLGLTTTTADFGGLPRALNACGYYVEFNTDATAIPPFLVGQSVIQPRWRFRLMEFLQPTEQLQIYKLPISGSTTDYQRWFTDFLPPNSMAAPVRVVAENIVALIVAPQLPPDSTEAPIAPDFSYDTREGLPKDPNHHQLPPLLRVVLIAIDEPSAVRLSQNAGTTPPTAITSALSGRFATANQLDADIATVSQALVDARITFRVFDTTIALRGAKWSQ